MARPFKLGLQYFPLEVSFFDDEKIIDLNVEHGILGEIIFIRLLGMIYSHGYFLEMNLPSLSRHLVKQMGPKSNTTPDEVARVIKYMGEIGLFNAELLHKGVYTSIPIQKQYLLAAKRRKGIGDYTYWLLNDRAMNEINCFLKTHVSNNDTSSEVFATLTQDNVYNNAKNVSETGVNAYKSTQKEKEKKKEKEIDKIDKLDKGGFSNPKMHFCTEALIKRKYIEATSIEIGKYNNLFESAVEMYGFSNVLTVVDYLLKYAKKATTPIEDNYSFLKKALLTNLEHFEKRDEHERVSFEEWFKSAIL